MEERDVFEALELVPHPLTIVCSGDVESGRINGMTAAWVSRVSWDPPMLAVAIAPERYTLELIKEFREFTVNVVSPSLVRAAMEVFGMLSGRSVNKFERAGVRYRRGRRVRAPILEEAHAAFECVLEAMYGAGDHVIVVGRVVNAWIGGLNPVIWYRESTHELRT